MVLDSAMEHSGERPYQVPSCSVSPRDVFQGGEDFSLEDFFVVSSEVSGQSFLLFVLQHMKSNEF